MGININCQYCDNFYQCRHPKQKKIFGFITKECIELRFSKVCQLAKRFPKPKYKPVRIPSKKY